MDSFPFPPPKKVYKMARHPAMSSSMLQKMANSHHQEVSKVTQSEPYHEIYTKLSAVREYMEKHEESLDSLSMREKTFLGWQLKAIYGMLFCISDTEEEESEDSDGNPTILLSEEGLFAME